MLSKCIMIQGTASSVGKSIITTGLCRIFKQDGFKCSPFKSQNMALNSFVTKDGKEMGRAQVVQAEAAGIEPSVQMNPILLKPVSNMKSQVIVNGKSLGNMSPDEYSAFIPTLTQMIKTTYDGLSQNNDIVVIEGAGSPAEINLRQSDIANMGMAEIADAPVLLVGDIDKGGVFASLAGTLLLLNEKERARVKGVIINKFRGNIEILKPGLKMLEDIIKLPVLGVVPMLDISIEDEDSVTERFSKQVNNNAAIDVAVIQVPYMSNFNDFNALQNVDGVTLRYVQNVSNLGTPDMIILPGSKNTIEALLFLRASGIENQIIKVNKSGILVFGICGGYQMLGNEIRDPYLTESEQLNINGIGLLNTTTVFQKEKTTVQVHGYICEDEHYTAGMSGIEIEGYEIHMGTTELMDGCVPFLMDNGVPGGTRNESGTVYGTYIHGIFDNMAFTNGLINNIRAKKGLEANREQSLSFKAFKETQYDMLADTLRESLDIEQIYTIAGLKGGSLSTIL